MKKDVKVIRDPKAIKVAVEDTRSNILSILRINDMSISQLAKSLDKDQSTIYRHIKKLEEYDYIEPTGEKKTHHIPEKIYGRTSGVFLLCPSNIDTGQPSEMMIEWERNKAERIIELLSIMGFDSDDGSELIEDISDIFIDLKERVIKPIEESEEDIGKISFATLLRLELLMFLLELRNDQELREKVNTALDKFTV